MGTRWLWLRRLCDAGFTLKPPDLIQRFQISARIRRGRGKGMEGKTFQIPAFILSGFPPPPLIPFPFLLRSLQRRMAITIDSTWDDDEWEICNDNGFVYKRRRRQRTAAEAEEGRLPPSEDPETEMRRHQMARRRRCLLGLRDKYRRELDQWQALSATLLDLASPIPTAGTAPPPSPPPSLPPPPGSAFSQSMDDLLSQVESQEAILRKLSEICDFVESMCTGQEERLAESLFSLPIWGSPRSLVASLSD